jgi:hypothetical protein
MVATLLKGKDGSIHDVPSPPVLKVHKPYGHGTHIYILKDGIAWSGVILVIWEVEIQSLGKQ